jgi:hypothetical protein
MRIRALRPRLRTRTTRSSSPPLRSMIFRAG